MSAGQARERSRRMKARNAEDDAVALAREALATDTLPDDETRRNVAVVILARGARVAAGYRSGRLT